MNEIESIPTFKRTDVRQLSFYRLSVELFTLSRKLKEIPHHNRPKHWSNLTAQQVLDLSQNVCVALVSLPFTIAEAEVTIDLSKKIKFQQLIVLKLRNVRTTLHTLDHLYRKDNHTIHLLHYKTKALEGILKKWSLSLTSTN